MSTLHRPELHASLEIIRGGRQVRAVKQAEARAPTFITVDEPHTKTERHFPGLPGIGRGLILFEDDHLLVANKPAGMNTHAPAPYAGEGLYDWLRHREPRWARLAIIQRLDKGTSGVMVFGKTPLANRSLTTQFAQHTATKSYLLLSDRPMPKPALEVVSNIVRLGEKYVSQSGRLESARAVTRFTRDQRKGNHVQIRAEPLTGRTHQIRVHAAENGFPILGDPLYGGRTWPRLCLHAERLRFRHPATGQLLDFHAEADFDQDPGLALRQAIVAGAETTAYRLVHGAGDGWPGWYVDRLGDHLLSQSAEQLTASQREFLAAQPAGKAVLHKILERQLRKTDPGKASPRVISGEPAPENVIRENGVRFETRFQEGYSVGLFLDQRENRRRLLRHHVAAGFPLFLPGSSNPNVLNTFAYTCGFSVCAAISGAHTTNIDLSAKYLDWGKRNFVLNDLPPADHEFLHGDVFNWLKRLGKKQRSFDVVLLDPPTFSQSKEHGIFRAETDYPALVASALPLLKKGGVLFASTNAGSLRPEDFMAQLIGAIEQSRRQIAAQHYAPQPPDFPIHPEEPAYLKTAWVRVS